MYKGSTKDMSLGNKYRNWTDTQLFLAMREDDTRAFGVIYDRYVPQLLNFVGRMLKDSLRAEDVVQNIFVRLYSMRKSLKVDTNLRSFLFVCAKNEVLNLLKSKWVSSVDSITPSVDVQDVSNLEEALIRKEQKRALEDYLSTLPDRRQEIFRMSRFEDMPAKEIASRLELSVRTVEKQLELATKDMRRKLN